MAWRSLIETLAGVVAALRKGDPALAAEILRLAVKMVLLDGLAWLKDKWYTVDLWLRKSRFRLSMFVLAVPVHVIRLLVKLKKRLWPRRP